MRHRLSRLDQLSPWISAFLWVIWLIWLVDLGGIFEMDYDEGYNLAKGVLIASGELLYFTIWSDQPPVLASLVAVSHTVFPWSILGPRVVVTVITGVLVWAIYSTAALLADPRPFHLADHHKRLMAGWTAVLLFFASKNIVPMSVAVDVGTPAVAFSALSLCLLLKAGVTPKNALFFFSGLLLAFACGTKLSVSFLLPVLLAFAFSTGLKNGLVWLAGLATGAALVFGPYLGSEMVSQLTTTHVTASASREFEFPMRLVKHDRYMYTVSAVAVLVLLWRRQWIAWPLIAWPTIIGLIFFFHQPLRPSYRLLLIVPAVMLIGTLAAWAWDRYKPGKWAVGLMLLVFCLPRYSNPEHWQVDQEPSVFWPQIREYIEPGKSMVTSRQTLSFHTKQTVPPNLAVTSLKRFRTGNLAADELTTNILETRPDYVFMDHRWPEHVQNAITPCLEVFYRPIYQNESAVLWETAEKRKSGNCDLLPAESDSTGPDSP